MNKKLVTNAARSVLLTLAALGSGSDWQSAGPTAPQTVIMNIFASSPKSRKDKRIVRCPPLSSMRPQRAIYLSTGNG
jgi:hypothetical protein